MNRRTLLAGVATGAVGFAGCLAQGDGGDDSDDGGNGDGDGDGVDGGNGGDGEDQGPPTLEDSSIETTATGCGSEDAGDATAERGDGQVTVDGVIGASNPCHRAVLESVEIHNRQLVVRVDVESTSDACQMCIGEVEYEATVTVANTDGLHGTTVEHVDGGEHVTNWEESEEGSP